MLSSLFIVLEESKWDWWHTGLGISLGGVSLVTITQNIFIPLFKFLMGKYPVIRKILHFLCKNVLTEEECRKKPKKVKISKK